MRRLGKLVIMTDKEHFCLMTQLEMTKGYKEVAEADLRKAEAARDNAIAVARRFHAAGGYSHRLPAVKEQLRHATTSLAHCIDLLVKWRPLVASLETTPGQFVDCKFDTQVAVTRELCGITQTGVDIAQGGETTYLTGWRDELGTWHYNDKWQSLFSAGLVKGELSAPADFLLVGEQVAQERRRA